MSAYEEAIFRVYDRSMEGVNTEDSVVEDMNRKTCETLEYILLIFTLIFGLFVAILHFAIVGQSGCLPGILHERMLAENRSSLVPEDAILQINVDDRFYKNGEFDTNRAVFDSTDDEIDMYDRRRLRATSGVEEFRKQVLAYEGRDRDVLQKHYIHTTLVGKTLRSLCTWCLPQFGGSPSSSSSSSSSLSSSLGHQEVPASYPARFLSEGTKEEKETKSNNSSSNSTAYDGFDPRYFQPFDYEYAYDIGVMSLSDKNRAKHNFTIINVTMEGEKCFGNGFIQSLIPFGGIDNVILNNVMYSLNKKGGLLSSRNDYYSWKEVDLKPYFNTGTWLGYKVGIATKIFFSYFLLSCSTAVLVRILISSGVVMIFPIFSLMHYAGIASDAEQHLRVISHAYPWLGVPMEMLIARGRSTVPFVIAHISRVVLYYTLFEALQFAVSIWFYDDPTPGQRELWLFATMMVWEYFSMVYVRAYSTILLFPRATFAAYAFYHIYMYSFPGGFHTLVLFVVFLLTCWLMLFCMRKYENEAYQRGIVNADQPRQLYNHLPYPVWTSALAPDFTLFLPLQFRSSSIYAEPVESVTGTGQGRDASRESEITHSVGGDTLGNTNEVGEVEMRTAGAEGGHEEGRTVQQFYSPLQSSSAHDRMSIA